MTTCLHRTFAGPSPRRVGHAMTDDTAPFSPTYCVIVDGPWMIVNAITCLAVLLSLSVVGYLMIVPVRAR